MPGVGSGRNAFAWRTAQDLVMVRGGGGRLRRAGEIIAVVVLTLTTRDFGLLLAAIALTMIFFFEWVFRHNVRVGRISEGRARAVRVLMLPWVYLAALGL